MIDALSYEALLVLLLTLAVFVAFVRAWVPPDIVAIGAVAALLLLGILSTEELLSVFSNSGPITVACMFVLSAALDRTGVIAAVGRSVTQLADRSRALAIAGLLAGVVVLSGFINNTPVVVVLTPVVIGLAHHLNFLPSKLLIPLSYAAILGGTCTLIGTSTNLLVDGVVRSSGMEPFGMFEITGMGLILAICGGLYLFLIGRWLLPDRQTLSGMFTNPSERRFLTEGLITHNSKLIGKTLSEAGLRRNPNADVIDIIRGERSLRNVLDTVTLEPGDRVVIQTHAREVIGLRETGQMEFAGGGSLELEPISTQQLMVIEGIVGPESRLVGRQVADLNLRRRYGVYVVAVHRQNENLTSAFDQLTLNFGDTLLLEGPPDGIKRLVEDRMLINLNQMTERPVRRQKAPIALLTIMAVMGLAAFNVMPIAGLAIIAVAAVVLLGCVRPDEIYEAIEWRILILIFGMLGLGMALEKTGAVEAIVQGAVYLAGDYGPYVMLSVIFLLGSIMTEMVSNNAVAVIMTPIAIGVADSLGVDARPFVVAVMFAASASFATPIGYQTNTFVYHAGGYRYTDFLKVGLPLNTMNWILASLLIPLIWPF
ncbi:SLC13 family permease [Fodinicurvata halophila]|uniref:SLC13 family permease n=1 Tax=Fodinicurvata halophila TaxID=1419723 RepID=A0ABV8UJZ2_9PROT